MRRGTDIISWGGETRGKGKRVHRPIEPEGLGPESWSGANKAGDGGCKKGKRFG